WPFRGRPPTRVLVALGLIVVLLAAWRLRFSPSVLLSLSAFGFAFALWALRAGGGLRFVGPLFFYDLARLARRGRATVLRCAYAGVLLAWLCVMVTDRFPGLLHDAFQAPAMSIREWAEFARGYGMVL